MKVFLQVFGGTCAVVLAVFIGNVAFTKYQLYEAQVVINKMTDNFKESSNQIENVHNYKASIDLLTKANKQLSRDLIAAQRKLKAYKVDQTNRQDSFAKYFTEPSDCLVFNSDAHMVECQNAKIRAKKEFNRLWDSGQRIF